MSSSNRMFRRPESPIPPAEFDEEFQTREFLEGTLEERTGLLRNEIKFSPYKSTPISPSLEFVQLNSTMDRTALENARGDNDLKAKNLLASSTRKIQALEKSSGQALDKDVTTLVKTYVDDTAYRVPEAWALPHKLSTWFSKILHVAKSTTTAEQLDTKSAVREIRQDLIDLLVCERNVLLAQHEITAREAATAARATLTRRA